MHKQAEKISCEINTVPKTPVIQKALFSWILVKFNAWNENCMSIPSITIPGNPGINLQNLANPGHLCKFSCQMSSPQTSMGAIILINFTLYRHFQDLNH